MTTSSHGIDFEMTDDQLALASAVGTMLDRRSHEHIATRAVWREIGELGVLGIGTEHVGGDLVDLAAATEALGAHGLQGPLIGAIVASRALDDPSDVIAGATWVGFHHEAVCAWGQEADLVLSVDSQGALAVVDLLDARPMATLAGEPWMYATAAVRTPTTRDATRALAAGDLARAAWMIGAARRLGALAAEHARGRSQFGRRIGDFQAVAHALAGADAEVGAARDLLYLAAWRQEHHRDVASTAAARFIAQRAALSMAFVAHQVHGALGFTVDRGLDAWSTAIRQIAHHPPGPATTAGLLEAAAPTRRLVGDPLRIEVG